MPFPIVGQSALGFRTFFGTWVAPGARVTFLGPAGVFEDTFTENNRVATLNAALARCRANKGDTIFALPGYSENVTTADFATSLVAGTNLIGLAPPNSGLTPLFTYTDPAASILLDVANVTIRGFKFAPGVDAIANYLNVTGSGCRISDCYFFNGLSSAGDVDVPIIVGNSASDLMIDGNTMLHIGNAVQTNLILVSGTSVNGLEIANNFLYGSCATTGLVNITGTGAAIRIHDNVLHQVTATTPIGIRHTDTALTGVIYNNLIAFTTDVTVLTAAISAVGVATANIRCMNNFACDEDSLGGVLVPTATGLE
jgi:hypothetical protein